MESFYVDDSTTTEMKYKEQFVYFKGAFSEDERYYNKFLRHGPVIVTWCNANNIKPKAFCTVATAICEYFDNHGTQTLWFATRTPEVKGVTFTAIADDNGLERNLVENVYNQMYDNTGSQILN